MKSITKRLITTLALCGALVLEAGATAIGSLGKALNNIAKVDAADTYTSVYLNNCPKSSSNSSYTSNYNATINNIEWNAPGNQYADGAWRVGGKVKDTYNRIFYTKTKIEADVSKIEFVLGTSSLKSLNSLVLDVYSTADAAASGGTTNRISSITKSSVSASSTIEFLHPGSDSKWENAFYRFTFNVTGSSTSTQYVLLNKIEFFKKNASTGYSLSFDANGGSGSQEELTSETSGTFTLPPTTTFNAPEGKAFDGWGTGTASSTKITTSQWTIPESGKTATLYALWKDVSYTDLPAGTYPIKIDYSGVTAGDTVPSSIFYTIKEDSGSTYYKKAKVEYTGVTASYANEYSWKASSHKMTFSSNSNAKVTKLSVKYYKANDLTVKNAAGTTITGTSVESVTNYNIKEYNINSTGFSLNGPSSGTMSVYEMTATLVVEDDSSVTDVINEINALPTAAYTQEFADKLNSALEHYNKLSASDQALVTNHNKLLTAQSSFNELRDAAVANVESLITQIGTVTADSGAKISTARNAYDALLADALGKSLVSNYSTLTAAEATYQDAQAVKAVEDLINTLPDATSIDDYSHHNDIAAARAAYEALSGTQKGMVSAALVTKLEACENAEKPYAPKEVTFYYNDSVSTSTNMTGENDAAILNADASQWEIKGYKGGHNMYPGLNKACNIRMYYHADGNNYIVIKPLIEDAKITTMTVNLNSGSPCKTIIVSNSSSTLTPSSGVYTVNDTEVTILSGATSNQQVYIDSIVCAYSIPTTSTITYNGLEGVDNSNNPTSYVEGTGCTIAAPKGSREGYTFIGWYDNPSYSGSAITSIPTTKTGNVTLYAKWQIKSHTYKIVYDNGTADATDTLNYGTTITIPAAPSKTGYEFLNWSDGTNTYNPGATVSMPDKDFTITAKYNVAKYTITFYKAVGEVFTTYTNKEYLSEIDLPSPAPTKEGFTFVGWAEDSSATEASWATGKYQVPAKNVDFYAVFTNAPAITGVTLANTFTSIELTEANSSFSATAEVSITPHSLDTTIDWSVSPADAGTLTNNSTNSGVSPIFTASKLYDEVTITATSHGDDNYYKSFTFAIVNPADEYVSDIVINEGSGVRKTYYSSETAVDMSGLTADATYKSTARPLYEDTRDVTSSATWTLDIANKKVIASLGGKTDYIAIEVIEKAIDHIVVDSQPSKTSYTIGDAFNPDGMIVKAIYNDASEETLTSNDYTVDVDMFAHGSGDSVTTPVTVKLNNSELAADPFNITISKFKPTPAVNEYQLVTSELEDYSGDYIFVAIGEDANKVAFKYAMDGGNATPGATQTHIDASELLTDNDTKIASNEKTDAMSFSVVQSDDKTGYYIITKTDTPQYIGSETSNKNGMKYSDSEGANFINHFTFNSETNETYITGVCSTNRLMYNKNLGTSGEMFRFYKDNGGTQTKVLLFKLVSNPAVDASLVKFDATLKDDSERIAGIDTVDVSSFNFTGLKNDATSATIDTTKVTMISSGNLVAGDNDIEFSYEGLTYHAHCNVKAKALTTYTLTVDCNSEQVEYEVDPTITDNKLVEGGDYTIEVSAKEGYVIESVTATGTGAVVSGDTVTITDASSDVSITVTSRALETFEITYDGTNAEYATISPKPTSIVEGDDLDLTVTANENKKIDAVVVTMDGVEQTGAYSAGKIHLDDVSGDIKITVDCSYITYEVDFSGSDEEITFNPATIEYNQGAEFNVTAEFSEFLYEIDLDNSSYSMEGGGTLSLVGNVLHADAVTGKITISLVLKEIPHEVEIDDSVEGYTISDISEDATGLTVTLALEEHYSALPSSIECSIDGTAGTKSYTVSDNKIVIPAEDVTGKVTLLTSATHADCSFVPGDIVGVEGSIISSPKDYEENVDYTFILKEGFDPETLTVTMTSYGSEFTDFELTKSGDTYHVKFVIVGDTVINIAAKAKITNDLTDTLVTTSNTDETIEVGANYTATLSFADGCDPDKTTVKVEMRDSLGDLQDITASAYDSTTHEISISSVTGEIIVTAHTELKQFNVTLSGDNLLDSDYATVVVCVDGKPVTLVGGSVKVTYGEFVQISIELKDGKKYADGYPVYLMDGSPEGLDWDDDDGILTVDSLTGDLSFEANIEKIGILPSVQYDATIINNTTSPVAIYQGEEVVYEFVIINPKAYEFDQETSKIETYVGGVLTDLTTESGVWYYDDDSGILRITISNPNTHVGIKIGHKYIEYTVTSPEDAKFYSLDVPETIHYGDKDVAIVVVADDYCYVDGVKVYLGTETLTVNVDYEYSSGVVTIKEIKGNYVIEATAAHDDVTITLDSSSENITFTLDDPQASYPYETTITGYFSVVAPYKLPGSIKVFEYGVEIGNNKYTYNSKTGVFSIKAEGDIKIIAKGSLGTFTVGLSEESSAYATLDPSPEVDYNEGSSFESKIVVDDGYQIVSVEVKMGDEIIKAFNAYDNSVFILNLTDNVEITVITAKVTLTNATLSNFKEVDSKFEATISLDEGYEFGTDSVVVKMGGTDITETAYDKNTGKITIGEVTGNIEITVKATKKSLNVTNALTNASNSSAAITSVEYGASYQAVISAVEGYENLSVTVKMGGVDVPCVNGVIIISKVTGDIEITASAVASKVNVSVDVTNVTCSIDSQQVDYNSALEFTLTQDDNTFDYVYSVTMGGEPVDGLNGVYTIEHVTGEIVIEASATIIELESISASLEYPYNLIDYDSDFPMEWLEVIAHYNNGDSQEVTSGITIEGFERTVSGEQTITVKALGLETTVDVEVLESTIVVNVSANTVEESYDFGYEFTKNDVDVYIEMSDGITYVMMPDDISGYDITKSGEQSITVYCGEYELQITVKINASTEIESISAVANKDNLTYGESFNASDVTVTAKYTDGLTEEISAEYVEFLGAPGKNTVVVHAAGKTCTVEVTVKASEVIDHIDALPNDISYAYGYELKASDFAVTATYTDGHEGTVDATAVVAEDLVPGLNVVVVKVGELSCNVVVKVDDSTEIASISAVIKDGKDTVAYEGAFTPDDVTVYATYTDGKTKVVTGFTMSGFDNKHIGVNTVTITLDGKTCTVKVTVLASTVVDHIEATATKDNLTYGDAFTKDDVKVTEVYTDGHKVENLAADSISGFTGEVGVNNVTVVYGGKEATIQVTVKPSEVIERIEAVVNEGKAELEYGAAFTKDDVTVTATYTDGHTAVVAADSVDFAGTVGENTVVVHVGDKTCEVKVTVKPSEVITGIEASTEKVDVQYGTAFTKDDVKAVYVYSDGHKVDAVVSSISGFNSTQLGKQTITVKVGEYETTIEITVSGRVVLSIEAIGYNQYVDQGKEYNFDGKVIAHYNDNTSEEVSGYTVEKVDTTGHGPQTVKVSYEGRSVEITINVIQTKTDTSPTAMTAIIGGSVVGVAILAVGIFFLLKSFKI